MGRGAGEAGGRAGRGGQGEEKTRGMEGGGGVAGLGEGGANWFFFSLAVGEGGWQAGVGAVGLVVAAGRVAWPLRPSSRCKGRPGGPEPRAGSWEAQPGELLHTVTPLCWIHDPATLRLVASQACPRVPVLSLPSPGPLSRMNVLGPQGDCGSLLLGPLQPGRHATPMCESRKHN